MGEVRAASDVRRTRGAPVRPEAAQAFYELYLATLHGVSEGRAAGRPECARGVRPRERPRLQALRAVYAVLAARLCDHARGAQRRDPAHAADAGAPS